MTSKIMIACMLAAAVITGAATAENQKDMEGKIFNVNPAGKSFELLVKTAYDPVTREEKSRYTVYWTDKTAFTKVITQKDFKEIKGPVIVRFNIQSKQTKALTEGRRFTFKHAEVDPESKNATGLSPDGKELVAWFTPNPDSKNNLDGTVSFKGKTIKAGLRGVKATVDILTPVNADELNVGIWKARLSGKNHNDKFIIDKITIYPQEDPRKTDVPGLPRVLVIGDSISINYHNAARNKLKGIANYYREEANCGPSDRGVECMNLWLGDYTRKGFGWDIIQFNHGLHDLRQKYDKTTKKWGEHQISVEDYKKNLEKEIIILKKTGAQLIWCTTTPVPNSSGGQYGRRKDEDLVYNKAALEVIGKYPEIYVNDLNGVVRNSKVFDKWREGKNVHFRGQEQEALGNAVAQAIIMVINEKNNNSRSSNIKSSKQKDKGK